MSIHELLNLVKEKRNQDQICQTSVPLTKCINVHPRLSLSPLPPLLRAWDPGWKQVPEKPDKMSLYQEPTVSKDLWSFTYL